MSETTNSPNVKINDSLYDINGNFLGVIEEVVLSNTSKDRTGNIITQKYVVRINIYERLKPDAGEVWQQEPAVAYDDSHITYDSWVVYG